MGSRNVLGFWSGLFGYGAVVLGMLVIGFATQQRYGITGLWLTEALAIALPAVFFLRGAGVRFGPFLGLNPPRWKHVGLAVVVSAFNQPVVSFLTWLAHENLPAKLVLEFDQKQQAIDAMFRGHEASMLAAVCIAAPLGEELFFRGFAFPAMSRGIGALAAAMLTGMFFSIIHMDPVGFLGLFEIGVMCAVMRHLSGSLWVAIIAHAVNNAIAGGAFLLDLEDPSVAPPKWLLLLGGAILAAYIVGAIRVLTRPSPVESREESADGPPRFDWLRALPAGIVWVLAFALSIPAAASVFHAALGHGQ